MRSNTTIARKEIKSLVSTIGLDNILNRHITEITARTGVSNHDLHNALNYFKYRKQ